ncbi:MAG: hypothetical protein DRN30_04225, partial [Thermoplasmata archaeon]
RIYKENNMSEETGAVEAVVESPVVEETGTGEIVNGAVSGDTVVEAESEAELVEEIEGAIEDGASEEEVKDMIREYEIKVNGKTKKVKIDLNNEEEIIKRLQMAEAGQSAMQGKAELEKMIESELRGAKEDPWKFLQDTLGLDADELAEHRIAARVEEMKKSPEQIEKEKISKELETLRAEMKKREQVEEDAKVTRFREEASFKLDQEITDALKDNTNLPKSRKTVSRIADAMMWAMNNGFGDVNVADVIPAVEAEIKTEFDEFMNGMPEDVLENYIGKRNLDRLRKKRVASAQAAKNTSIGDVKAVAADKKDDVERDAFGRKTAKKVRSKDFFKNLGN